jgi:transposase-like protein
MAISCKGAHFPQVIMLKIQYFNHVVAQDHRALKRVTRPMVGFKAFEATQATLTGIERMHMIKKKPMVIEARDEGLTAAELFYALAA